MSVNLENIVKKINDIIKFSNETRHALHIAYPNDKLLKEILITGVTSTHGPLHPFIKQLTYITKSDIIKKSIAGKNRKKATRKKAVKY